MVINATGSGTYRVIGFIFTVLGSFLAVFGPLLAPYHPNEVVAAPFQLPSFSHLLGTNDMGYDIFSEVLYGARISLIIGIIASLISTGLGTLLGTVAGYYRGIIEDGIMGITDVFFVIPALPLMIVLSALTKASIWNIILVIGLLSWTATARVVHSKILQLREMPFVASAVCLGYRDAYILRKHLIPNTNQIIYSKFSMAVAGAMLSEASIAFLGLGDPSFISWGQIINFAFNRGGFALGLWWWYVVPGGMICLTVLGFIFAGGDLNRQLAYGKMI